MRRRWQGRRVTARAVLLAAAVVSVLAGAPASAAERPLVVRADVQVAGFRTHEHLGDAMRVFGKPASLRLLPGYQHRCDAGWPRIGLTIRFFAQGCKPGAAFVRATATGSRWQTIRKLAIRDTVQQLRALYPDAKYTVVANGSRRWSLFRRGDTTAGLTAITTEGRVSALIVSAAVFTVSIRK